MCDVRHLLLQAMMATAMADDHLADEETAALRDVYAEVMQCSLDAAELAQVSEEMHAAGVQVRGRASLQVRVRSGSGTETR